MMKSAYRVVLRFDAYLIKEISVIKKSFGVFLLGSMLVSPVLAGEVGVKKLSFEVSKGVPSDFVKKLVETYPSTKFKKISTTPVPGVYEVQMGRNVVYVSSDARHMFLGHLVDMVSRKDLTEPVLKKLRTVRIDLREIPFDKVITVKKGDGSRHLFVFTDPECPYCRKLEQILSDIDGISIHYLMFPLAIHPTAKKKAEQIYCSKDPQSAIKRVILLGQSLSEGDVKEGCKAPINEIISVGARLGIQGTPTLIFEDGEMIQGFMPKPALIKKLNEAHKFVEDIKKKESKSGQPDGNKG